MLKENRWVISHGQEHMHLDKRSPDFVTFRGVLSMIMSTPYEKFEGWIVCATKFKGTIYLCRYDTPQKIKNEESRTTREKDMCDWGYKFEQFLLSEQPGGTPDVETPNNQNEEFSCVFQATIGPYNLVYAAEMDGVNLRNGGPKFAGFGDDSKRLKEMLNDGKAEFVELKTSADASTNNREWQKIRRFKSRKWWAQCQLVGIDKLICGYRDEEGIVRKLDEFSVRKLPQLGRGFWDSNVCMEYLVNFLKLVVEQVSSGYDEQLWMFTWNPKESNCIQVELCDRNSPYSFLHEWVINGLKSNKRKNEESVDDSAGCSSKKT
ncbi:decapping and exoribonuclease protein-like isoform X2 [Hetaerina americana]|uniref:decapping and exoribonuclease protein-like isoform X2 n=1 Tax=Hetaerina americana TaxID=62018 RepID=UPI003A7F5F96